MPRFAPAAYATNLCLLEAYRALATDAGITPAQLALAWVLGRGDHVVTSLGTTRLAQLRENVAAAAVSLPPAVVAQAEVLFGPGRMVGGRYSALSQSEVDTEQFAPA